MTAYVVVDFPTGMPPWSKSPFTSTSKDIGSKKIVLGTFSSVSSSQKIKGEIASLFFGSSLGFIKIAVAKGVSVALFVSKT